jgi:2-iminobutanoate/2-iminopropanoate deaminase
MKSIVNTDKAPAAIGPYSQAVKAGNFMFISGQIPVDPTTGNVVSGGVAAQTKMVLDNITAILNSQNLELGNVVKTTVFLTDLNDFEAVNKVYGEYFAKDAPARCCVQIGRLPKGVSIEIEAIAYL